MPSFKNTLGLLTVSSLILAGYCMPLADPANAPTQVVPISNPLQARDYGYQTVDPVKTATDAIAPVESAVDAYKANPDAVNAAAVQKFVDDAKTAAEAVGTNVAGFSDLITALHAMCAAAEKAVADPCQDTVQALVDAETAVCAAKDKIEGQPAASPTY